MRITQIFQTFLILCMVGVHAERPALREEASLNGTWDFYPDGGSKKIAMPVPEYWDAKPGQSCKWAKYERTVSIPQDWAGKRIKIEFEGVSQMADVYANGEKVGSHIGAWLPFSFDVTDQVQAGQSFKLRVDVKGGSLSPIMDGKQPVWPVGWYGHEQQWGIPFDTWVRAYGTVHIDDAFIQTSYRKKTITIDYTIVNTTNQSQSIQIQSKTVKEKGEQIGIDQKSDVISIPAGAKITHKVTYPWTNPDLWSSQFPNLYLLHSSLIANGKEIDKETQRFGFREVWTEKTKIMFNGHRINLYGSSDSWFTQNYKTSRYTYSTRTTWPNTVDKIKSTNQNIWRFHMGPRPRHLIDIADEKGLFIVDESAAYARNYLNKNEAFLKNAAKWNEQWVKGRRNHPSIIIWSAENELKIYRPGYNCTELKPLGDAIKKHDQTRLVTFDGDGDCGHELVNIHYPEGYENSYSGSIYNWKNRLHASKPTGIGEFLVNYRSNSEANKWWHGSLGRGLRYLGFTDVRYYTTTWIFDEPSNSTRLKNFTNAHAPVALFDYNYDDLGLAPVRDGKYPSLDAGANVSRNLVVYNDEFADENVTLIITIKSGNTVYASGNQTVRVPLGESVSFKSSFQVPHTDGARMSMILETKKGNRNTFSEERIFNVNKKASSGQTSKSIQFSIDPTSVTTAFNRAIQLQKQETKMFRNVTGQLKKRESLQILY